MTKELEALEQLKAINKYDGGKYHTLGNEKEMKIVEKGLKVLEVLSNHKLLNLCLLDDYDVSEYEEYYDKTSGTTDELNFDEFIILKEWQWQRDINMMKFIRVYKSYSIHKNIKTGKYAVLVPCKGYIEFKSMNKCKQFIRQLCNEE